MAGGEFLFPSPYYRTALEKQCEKYNVKTNFMLELSEIDKNK